MTVPAPDPADWAPIITAVAEYQRRSERDGSFLRDAAEIEQRFDGLEVFYRMIGDDNVPADVLAVIAEPLSGPPFGPLGVEELAVLSQDLAVYPIRFTPAELPATAAYLARSFARVSRFVYPADAKHEFLFATDYRYRPHASVQQWAQDRYLVLMGRFVLIDLLSLAMVLGRLIIKASARFRRLEQPWAHSKFPQALLAAAKANPLLHQQIAYGMCCAAEGERYRLGFQFDDPPAQAAIIRQVTGEVAAGLLDFLVGHELSHVGLGHLQTAGRPSGAPPWYASKTFDQIRSLRGGPSAVEEYLRRHWPTHRLEIEADLAAVAWAAKPGEAGADLRLMGTQFAVSLISFLDRANYLMKFGRDAAEAVGLREYNSLPGLIDVALPMPTPPWGKTRAFAVNNGVQKLYEDLIDPVEIRRKVELMRAVASLVGTVSGQALRVIHWISQGPGEYMATPLPGDRLFTVHWPTTDRTDTEVFLSAASKFYTDNPPKADPDGPHRWRH
jgi:hypothetical protein